MNFRYDINGLRAFAVLVVVLFHFSVPGFAAGFLGVDVFFVISGYLMTDIIMRNVQQRRFSLVEFYLARSRRIIPALAALCLILLLIGYWILIPKDYELLGKHVAASIGFISNEVYLSESGYFNALSHEKLLLHTWSLSVEWQFYLIFPLIVLALAKLGSNFVKIGLVVLMFGSAFFAMNSLSTTPDEGYFRFYSRVWEMMLGGMVVLFPFKVMKGYDKVLFLFMLSLLAGSMLLIDKSTPWPGYMALLPTIATAGLLYASNQTSVLFNNPFMQWIGTRSYSIYLWHWPVSSLLVLAGLSQRLEFQLAGIGLSLFAGHISYKIIEQPAGRFKWFRLPGFKGVLIFVLMFVLVWLAGRLVFVKDGFPERLEKTGQEEQLVMPTRRNGWCFNDFDKKNSHLPGESIAVCELLVEHESGKHGLLFGDSFAAHYEPLWKQALSGFGHKLSAMTTNWCYPSMNQAFIGQKTHPSYQQCLINRKLLVNSAEQYDFIILAGHWQKVAAAGRMEEVHQLADYLTGMGVAVILMASPTIYDVDVLKRYRFSRLNGLPFDIQSVSKEADNRVVELNDELERFTHQRDSMYMATREDLFSLNGTSQEISADGIPYSLDGRHLSVYGAIQAVPTFMRSDVMARLRSDSIF